MTVGLKIGENPDVMYELPQLPEYQFHFPLVPRLPPVMLRVVELPEQIVEGVAVNEEGTVDKVLIVIVLLTQGVVLQAS